MKLILGVVLVAIVAIGLYGYGKNIRPIREAGKAVEEINRRAPIKVADGMQVDGAAMADKFVQVSYRITALEARDVKWTDLQPELKKAAIKATCSNSALRAAIMANMVFESIWLSKEGKELGRIRIDRTDC